MQRVLIFGAGGHAQVVADILLQLRNAGEPIQPIGFLDDNPEAHGRQVLGLPILTSFAGRVHIAYDALVMGVGDNYVRSFIIEQVQQQGERLLTVKHPQAILASDVVVGNGTVICAGAIVGTGSRIGVGAILNTACTVDHHAQIGNFAHVAPGAHLAGHVTVHEGTLIGTGAAVVPHISIGSWSVVGAGAAVVSNIPDRVMVVGVPGRVIKHL